MIKNLFNVNEIESLVERDGYWVLRDINGIQYKFELKDTKMVVRGKLPSGNWSKILMEFKDYSFFDELLNESAKEGILENFASKVLKQREEMSTRIWWEDLQKNNIAKIKVEVTKVIDGDTLHIKFKTGEIERIRTRYIDTPEIGHYDDSGIYRKYEASYAPQGVKATKFLRKWVEERNNIIELNFRIDEDEELYVDKYGRVLAYLKGYSEEVVKKGLALPMYHFFIPPLLKNKLVEAMNIAKDKKIGLFNKEANSEKRRLLKIRSEEEQKI